MDTEKLSLCRICLQEGATYPIFDEVDFQNNIHSKLSKCLSEKIEDEEGFPRNICSECNNTVNLLYQFIKKFEESSKILRNLHSVKTELGCEYSDNDSDFIWPDNEFKEIKLENIIEKEDESETTKILTKLKPLVDLKVTKVKNKSKSKQRKINRTNKIASSILESDFVWSGQKWCLEKEKTKIIKKEIPTKQKEINKKKVKENTKPKEKEQSKLCNICGDIFKNAMRLRNHMETAHSEEKATCPICYKEYRSQYRLKEHKRRYHGGKKLLCTFCPQVFASQSLLTEHVKKVHNKHLKPKKYYSCKICDKTYKCKKSVVVHERSFHTGFRPAECKVCSKTFFHDDYLKEHMRLHTGELPFKCPICARGYTQLGNMKSHLRIHKISELNETILSKMRPNYLKLLKNC